METKPGNLLTPQQLDECLHLLREGRAIKYLKIAEEGLRSAFCVVTLTESSKIIGMGAIKAPRPEYAERISKRSGFPLPPYRRELGYITVDKDYREWGLAKQIVRKLLEFDSSVFAITSNEAMKAIFRRTHFSPVGNEWEGKEGDKLTLWMRDL